MDGRGGRQSVKSRVAPGQERHHETFVHFEVPFHDVDALGIVWHGHYYKYLELARTALLRARGLDGRDLLGLGFGMVVIESGCRHVAPLRYGDRARVSAWFADLTHRVSIRYEITREDDGSRVARAHTILATVDPSGRLLMRTPKVLLDRLAPRPSADAP